MRTPWPSKRQNDFSKTIGSHYSKRSDESSLTLQSRSALPISMKDLQEDWRLWLNDYRGGGLRFGQYVLNKRLVRGWVWSDCYYASTEKAWNYLFDWINYPAPVKGPRPFLS